MKILQIYKDFYPPTIGGIEKHLNLLSKKIHSLGIDVEVLVSNTRNRLDVDYVDAIKVTKIPQWGRLLSAPLNPTIGYWIRELGASCDILHFHLPNPTGVMGYLMSGLNKPVVVTYHSDIVRQRRASKLFSPFLRYFLSHDVAKIIATSQNIKENSNVLKQYTQKTDVIPLGIEVDQCMLFGDQANIQRLKEKYDDKILLFIGKFRYYKGLNVLIEAMCKIDATLMIVGKGPCAGIIKEAVERYGLHEKIIFMNEVSDALLLDCIHASQMLILPSVEKSEAFGLVLLEAMACGKPVISTDLGTGTSFVNVHNHTGLVVSPKNISDLAQAVQQLLDKPEEKKKFGDNARKRAIEYFNVDLMTSRTMELYSSVQK
jgi:glycosyltransferase involved in cell wall biosynthesis